MSCASPSGERTEVSRCPREHRASIPRRLELLLMVLVVAWLAAIVWLTFVEPLDTGDGAGVGFWLLAVGLLLGAPDIIIPPAPRVCTFLAFFTTMTATTFVGYHEFGVAARSPAFYAGDSFLLVVAIVVLVNLYVVRIFRRN